MQTSDKLESQITEIFKRLAALETQVALAKQADITILEKIENLDDKFNDHDIKEMKKYEDIQKEIGKFQKIVWIGIGVGVTFNMIAFALALAVTISKLGAK